MQIFTKDVEAYLQEVPKERLETLTKLRQLCLETLTSYEESMDYGMPCYKKDGTVEVAFASQKNFIAFYILKKEVFDAHRDALNIRGVSMGKGCIRYSKPEKIDFTVVEKILEETLESTNEICE
jgi:uncharacterized protein YdhG (YjbR/CyaY superfamily)